MGRPQRAEGGEIEIVRAGGSENVELDRIVYYSRIKSEQSLWDAIDKDLRVGFSYTQASDVLRWSAGGGLGYKTPKSTINLRFDSLVTNSSRSGDSRRGDLTGDYRRHLQNRYLWFVSSSLQTNDELGVNGRVLVSGGVGRYVWQTGQSELRLAIGLAGNVENPTGAPNSDNSNNATLEGMLDIDWTVFKLSTPSSRISARLEYYPGLTESGRNRVDLKLNLRQEFWKDLFWVVEAYGSHDSNPPPGAISGDDYGITTSLAYEW